MKDGPSRTAAPDRRGASTGTGSASAPDRPSQTYLLGTQDDEIERLGLQHRIWRPHVLACWRRAGITVGSRVLDAGAGPGYATVDLAEIVGPGGHVTALERSPRFLAVARAACAARGFPNVEFHETDLMGALPDLRGFDVAWCRWVAAFVSSPQKLVAAIAGALRPGGAAVFHEYANYLSFSLAPRGTALESLKATIVRDWRASGGEPDVGRELPRLLHEAGFRLQRMAPLVFIVRPKDFMWQWPASFIRIHLRHLLEEGRAEKPWADSVLDELRAAETDPSAYFITPLVVGIIARKRG
jgi:SAM-dependent methyltransferase